MKIFSSQKNYNLPIYDYNLIWATLLLLGIGLVMVYSSSIDIAAASKSLNYQNYYYLVRQFIYITIGFIFGYITFQIPIYFWQKMAPYICVFGLFLLGLVFQIKNTNTVEILISPKKIKKWRFSNGS